MASTRQPDPERTKPAAHREEPVMAIPEPAPGPKTTTGRSVPGETPHDPGRPVAAAGVMPTGVSAGVAKALAKESRDQSVVRETREQFQARQAREGDPHGAPAAAGHVVGDEAVVAECLAALAKVTDPDSLARIKASVDGRVGTPEQREPKASGHTV